ncbi:MAG TPA: PQQ-binding-like beta-propeller repeat protein [Tahibacter sp.]|uniref:outer membrane protein assembly factor BamB family protein n=1 Tax=Tahibacter sp. TaxID=2056211 RepID=UPI002BC43838|nr:PQQ-binding-like beta-propeller repeat protein [Tahibacter sp.]HSX62414.1 PQQ-binding-like beta-propeller repeat protein [Tahibacter sp.]
MSPTARSPKPNAPNPVRTRLRAVAALLLVAPFAATADWRYEQAMPDEPVVPTYYRIGTDYALWTVAADGVYRSAAGVTRQVHRNATGERLPADSVRDLVPLADGGALLDLSAIRDGLGGYCAAKRIDANGRERWRVELPLRDEICHGYFANAAGQGWFLATEKLIRIDADGRVGEPANAVGQPYVTRPVAVYADGGAVAATRLRGVTTSRLMRFDPQGNERWTWVREDQKPLSFVTLAGDGVVAVATDVATAAVDLVRVGADGQLQWTHGLPPQRFMTDVIAADGGDVYVVVTRDQYRAGTLLRVGADGRLRWQLAADCDMPAISGTPIARLRDDSIALVCQDGGLTSRLLRVTAAGASSALTLPLHRATQIVQQGDGRLLVLGHRPSLDQPPTRHTLIVDGTQVAVAAIDGYRAAAPGRLIGQAILADGTSFIAVAPAITQAGTRGATLTRLAADGGITWTRRVELPAYLGGDALAVGGGLACLALADSVDNSLVMGSVLCADAESGETRWRGAYANDQRYRLAAIAITADAKVYTVRSGDNGHEVQRFGRDGQIETSVRGPRPARRAVFDAHGAATVVTSNELRQYAPDGALRMNVTSAPIWLDYVVEGFLLSDDDGSVWMIGPPSPGSSNGRRLWAVAPDGRTRWTRDLDAVGFTRLLRQRDALYGVGMRSGSTGADRSVEIVLERMNAATGAMVWSHASRHHPFGSSALAASADADDILVAHSERDRLHVERVSANSGNLVHDAWLACDALCGAPAALSLDATHTARTAFDVLDRDRGQTGAVVASDLSAATTRLDQPGIAGAWWSPYAHGEGIAFDWLPVSRTLFGAWFTFSTTGGNETEQLRWYTLQANGVADGARRLDLPILETTGGNFDAAPNVSPRRVGTAQVEFHDCARATLRYAFDANVNEARSGTITLSRLSPATQPCVLADGSTQPAPGAQPPAHGFDAKQSGTWFDETAVGQGLQFTVQPNGTFFAPWFTFDPADAGDDLGRQHWFTLQGNLAEARDGVAPLVLVQTLGGRFDSVPTYNATAIGTATLRLRACDRADLDYRFDDIPGAGAFRGRSGSLRLSRAGGCAP